MAGGSAEGEVNHWPAFVDVLTTVIMVVTFLLVIMSAAVMVLSQRAVEHFKANYAAQHHKDGDAPKTAGTTAAAATGKDDATLRSPPGAPPGTSISELGAVLKTDVPVNGEERLSIRTRETPETLRLAVKADEVPDATQGVKVETADVLLRLDFDAMAVRLDADTEAKVKDFVAARAVGGADYEIWSSAPQSMSVTEAQRLAFYRAAMVRNVLIRAGIGGGRIKTQVRVTDPASKDGHNVRVVVKP